MLADFRNWKIEKELAGLIWKIDPKEIQFITQDGYAAGLGASRVSHAEVQKENSFLCHPSFIGYSGQSRFRRRARNQQPLARRFPLFGQVSRRPGGYQGDPVREEVARNHSCDEDGNEEGKTVWYMLRVMSSAQLILWFVLDARPSSRQRQQLHGHHREE